uniref:phosphopyruvate hydratase n=1 Tax=Leptocylindrus danicus TaxID=163516 RepID=A0A7S2LB08_9STRA|mmetsp:Transcript_34285/g.49811  ORF Transcript_34285/g.49811 Transcript_34285/m.49811 type:complete len:462 (+) Transcript_34285:81-1466(+)|eukprot:CAMPEP_0116026756 /NCGR_PEP_ID=MMETSP0321-20121206/14096_1 /TAXON_ID=163516 /ORGANISM="Leptocylindrus danicus var. danicus, Strain B650" /LENGTH=461 /DNA_ID=CAMNT_0003499727 /DNA_START=42 /DNA_END=1427 /DNA_ORIENTATION=-
MLSTAANTLRTASTRATSRSMSSITGIKAREIIDSRGNPTVEVDVTTKDGTFTASVPSGASTGAYEAVELRDGGSRYMGKGCLQAVENVNTVLADAVMNLDVADQRAVDDAMIAADGTPNKGTLGANAILGVSLAASKAGAAAKGVPLYQHYADIAGNPTPDTLPVPCFNVINGGEHAGNKLAFQEFFVIPTGAETFTESMEIGCEVFHNLKSVIKKKFGGDATLIGDEGGFAPPCDVESGLQLIMEATEQAGYLDKVSVGLDVASSEFKVADKNEYDLDFKTSGAEKDSSLLLSGDELIAFYKDMISKYPIKTIEDPFDQDDWDNWTAFCQAVGKDVQIVGDDLTVTNPTKIKEAIEKGSANCLLLKVNQIGSISESIDAVKLSKQNGWGVMTSHRSGETEDSYIADLAVGLCTGQIKTGAPCRGERTAKYNQLLRIEAELGGSAIYPGAGFRSTNWMGN